MTNIAERELMREIAAKHANNAPRLEYADWLERNGDPLRAEYIRISCQLAGDSHLNRFFDDSAYDRLLAEKAEKILMRMQKNWTAELREYGFKKIEFQRGIIEKVTINASTCLSKVPAIFEKYPTIISAKIVELHRRDVSFVDEFLSIQCMQQLRSLDVSYSRLGADEATKIGNSKYLPNVETLRINQNPIHERGMKCILSGVGLPNLKHLDISSCNLGDEFEIDETFQNPQFKSLQTLKATDMFWAAGTTLDVLARINLNNLKVLHIDGNFGDSDRYSESTSLADCKRFFNSPSFAKIEALVIEGHMLDHVTDEVAQALCNHQNSENIKYLFMSSNGLKALANSEAIWTKLKTVGLTPCLDERDLQLVLDTPKFSRLDLLYSGISFDVNPSPRHWVEKVKEKHQIEFHIGNTECLIW